MISWEGISRCQRWRTIPLMRILIHPAAVHAMHPTIQDAEDVEEETLSLEEVEKEMIRKALEKHNGRRKNAAADLKISERTLYRKIKEYNLE